MANKRTQPNGEGLRCPDCQNVLVGSGDNLRCLGCPYDAARDPREPLAKEGSEEAERQLREMDGLPSKEEEERLAEMRAEAVREGSVDPDVTVDAKLAEDRGDGPPPPDAPLQARAAGPSAEHVKKPNQAEVQPLHGGGAPRGVQSHPNPNLDADPSPDVNDKRPRTTTPP